MDCPKCGGILSSKPQSVKNDVCFLYVCTDPSCEVIKVEVIVWK